MSERNKDRHTRAWRSWRGMKARCLDPRNPWYPDYGGRGITICDRWLSLANFKVDMGEPPPGHSLDRIDNDQGYSPENCRWATPLQQSRNRRNVRQVTVCGVTKPLPEWADLCGLSVRALRLRLDSGWSPEDAVLCPPRGSFKGKPRSMSWAEWTRSQGLEITHFDDFTEAARDGGSGHRPPRAA